jgi:cobalt-precorrin 5A hydrolase
MVGDQTMSPKIAIGVGCRHRCPAGLIEEVVRQALSRAPAADRLGLFTIADKREEAGLTKAAASLGLDLVILPREALREKAAFVQTRSIRTESLFGVPSVAEAAALAGAGPGSVLIFARIANKGATCAVARSQQDPS